jgi:Flp pilus assembly protein TadG
MHRWSGWRGNDDGSAALEFIAVGVILLVPLVYLIIALGAIQEQTLGVEAAARHMARAIATAPDAAAAAARGDAVLAGVVDEYGLDAEAVEVALRCEPAVLECPSAGATLLVTVASRVRMPLVPPVFGLERAGSVEVRAEAAQKISRLWGVGE